MNKTKIILTLVTFLNFGVSATEAVAKTVYVDDQKAMVWTRTGPSSGHKVKNKYAPGERFDLLQVDEASKYSQIRDSKGRVSWMPSEYLTARVPAKESLAIAERTIERLRKSHAEKVSELEKRLTELSPLEGINQELQTKVAKLDLELEQSREKSQMYRQGFYSDVLFSGAIVIVFGMIIGWLLTKIKSGKRASRWK
jgi:SH3 domain protein